MLELVILMGLPAAGKTTFFRERFASSHVHVSKDLFPNNRRPARRQEVLIDQALGAGRSVVVDNTNVTLQDRADLIAAARRHGARVIGYFFESSTRESVARNAARTGRARIPNVGIFAAAKRLAPPSRAEGFDELYRVRTVVGGGFEIAPAGARAGGPAAAEPSFEPPAGRPAG